MTAPPKLQAQEFEIPLTLGMATKPAAELQEPTHLRLVENLHWRELGGLEHRPSDGADVTLTAPSGGYYDETTAACGLIVRGDEVCAVSSQHGVMPYDQVSGALRYTRADTAASNTPGPGLKSCPAPVEVSRQLVHSAQSNAGSHGVTLVASAQHDGVQVVAWIEDGTTARLCMKAIDPFTGTTLATLEYRDFASLALAVDACEYTEAGKEGVLIAYVDGTFAPYTVRTFRYDAATNEFVADSNLSTNSTLAFTLAKNGDRIYFGYEKSSTTLLTVEDRTIGSISSTHTGTHSAAFGVSIVKGTNRTLIASCTATTAYAEVFGTPAAAITLLSASSEAFSGITACHETVTGITDNAVVWVNAITTSTPIAERVRHREVDFDATTPVGGVGEDLQHCRVAAAAFTLHGRAHAVFAVNGYGVRGVSTCIVARWQGDFDIRKHAPVAKLMHDRFYALPVTSSDNARNSVCVDDNDNAWVVLTGDPAVDDIDGGVLYPQSVFLARLNAARPMPMSYAQSAPGVVFCAGGVPWEFDGSTAYEAAPLVAPKIEVDISAGTGITGTFGIIAVYNFVDAAGRLHRVASQPVSTAPTNDQLDIYVSKCPFRAFDGNTTLQDMEPDLYVTADNGSTYFLANDSSGDKMLPTTSGGWWKFTAYDPANNSAIPLGIDGSGEIPPEPTPAFLHVTRIADRMWAIDAEDRSRVWYSKPLVAGIAAEWAVQCTLFIGGDGVAIIDVGGYPTILARDGIYQIGGPGPDANGVGSFSPAQRLPFEVECLDPASVCRTPIGIVFRGRRGLYAFADGPRAEPGLLIDPEMLTAANLDPSTSATYRLRVAYQEQTNEIHCITPAGDRLVYNVVEQKWSKYTTSNTTCADVAVARGKLWRLEHGTVSGLNLLRSEKLYSEDGATYNENSHDWEVRTPWIKLDGLGGHERLWRLWVSLSLPSDVADISSLDVKFYANNSETLRRQQSWTGSELAAVYDPSTGETIVRLPFAPSVQLVHSFRIHVVCVIGQANPTSGPRPLALRCQVGVRPSKSKRNPLAIKG